MIQSAVIRQLEIAGEAVKNLSVDLVSRETAVSWKQAARTRDLLIHGYFRIDLDGSGAASIGGLPSLKHADDIVTFLKPLG